MEVEGPASKTRPRRVYGSRLRAEAKRRMKEEVVGTVERTRSLTQNKGKGGRPAKDRKAKREEIFMAKGQQQSNKLIL